MPTDWTLALDTTSARGSVALLNQGSLHAARNLLSRNYGDELFVVVGALLAEAGITLLDLARVAVADGPGSFTGVRIGLSAAKGWHEALGLPIAPVSTLRAVVGHRPVPAIGVLDASRGYVYFGVYESGRVLEGMEPLDEFRRRLDTYAVAAFTPDDALRSALPQLQPADAQLAPAVGWLAWRAGAAGVAQNVMALDARYLRAPDAALPVPR